MPVFNEFTTLIFVLMVKFIFAAISKYPTVDEFNNSVDRQHQHQQEPEPQQQLNSNISLQPVFDFGMPRNITTRVGQTAFLNCRVEQLGDKSVSWIRKRDLHILTAGILTYTSDGRFQVLRQEGSNDWTLQVKFSQLRDSGIYECQVNTEPKMSMAFRLNVIVSSPEAKAIVVGPPDLYVKAGSAITLTCLVKQAPHEIGPIHWYRGDFIITPFDIHPNDLTLDLSRRISMESQLGDSLKSRLRIANAQTSDTGNYTCLPTTAEGASVMVHIISGEHPAAMQRGSATSPFQSSFNNNCYHSSLVHIIILIKLINTLIL